MATEEHGKKEFISENYFSDTGLWDGEINEHSQPHPRGFQIIN
jgi:hypothetical protein